MSEIKCMATFNSSLYASIKFRDRLSYFFVSGEWRAFIEMDNGELAWVKAANGLGRVK